MTEGKERNEIESAGVQRFFISAITAEICQTVLRLGCEVGRNLFLLPKTITGCRSIEKFCLENRFTFSVNEFNWENFLTRVNRDKRT